MSTPRFLADEDLHGQIIDGLRRREPTIDLLTVVEAGASGFSDAAVLDLAHAENRIVVSHDVSTMRSTAEQRVAGRKGLTGLFLATQDKPIHDVIDWLLLIWAATEAEEWRDKVIFLPL